MPINFFCDYLDLFRIYDFIDIVSKLDAIDRINFYSKTYSIFILLDILGKFSCLSSHKENSIIRLVEKYIQAQINGFSKYFLVLICTCLENFIHWIYIPNSAT